MRERDHKRGERPRSRHRRREARGRPGPVEARPRGREAQAPCDIPALGWRDILIRVWRQTDEDNVALVAAGVAFYALLSVFPALAALVSLYGLVSAPAEIAGHLEALTIVPSEGRAILAEELSRLVSQSSSELGVAFFGGLAIAIYSATRGMSSLLTAVAVAYEERNHYGLIAHYALSFLLTIGAIVMGVLALALLAGLPIALDQLGLGGIAEASVRALRWLVLIVFALLGLAVLYRYGPPRKQARWRWVSWGSAVATTLWLGGSFGLTLYVESIGRFARTYGSLGAVVILLLWLWLGAYIVILGAELNAEMEHQTGADTTSGKDKPMGERGAYVADHLGPVP